MTSCSIIIPVFNHAALTRQCLAAVQTDAEIIVVDDASTEPLPDFGVRVLRHETNTGFATACNDGVAAARGEFLIFLNNDTIPQPGWLEALVEYARQHPQASVIGSKLLFPTGTVQHAGVVICQDRYPRHIYAGFPSDHPAVNKPRRFQIVTAACALVRRAAFAQVGGFDTAYRNGFEDVELCLRLGELGHEIHYCPASVVTHLESVSEGRFRHANQNVDTYRQRWLGRVRPDDLQYYLDDGLLKFEYEGQYPVRLTVAPLLATVGQSDTDQLLKQRTDELQDLARENTRLSVELKRVAERSPELEYRELRGQILEAVRQAIPPEASVLVVSKGDGALLKLDSRRTGHFPQTDTGAYAGHHLADSAAAIAHLEKLRRQGAQYLVFPATAFWWLDHYKEFVQHLASSCRQVTGRDGSCAIFELRTDTRGAACLLNSLPKSGTHLLSRVVSLLPGMEDSGVLFPPPNGRAVTGKDSVLVGVGSPTRFARDEIRAELRRIGRGAFATGHVSFSTEMTTLLAEQKMKAVLIIRDPRDVAVSHARYIPETPDHGLHKVYLPLAPAERLMISLAGWQDAATGIHFLNIRERLEAVLPWREHAVNYTTTFERLVGPAGGGTRTAQVEEIRRISDHLGIACSEEQIVAVAEQAFSSSPTFRKGVIGAWREHFNADHKRRCKELIGARLIELGYEKDLDW